MKETIAVLGFLFMTVVLMSLLIPSILLDMDDRREARRKARGGVRDV